MASCRGERDHGSVNRYRKITRVELGFNFVAGLMGQNCSLPWFLSVVQGLVELVVQGGNIVD